MTEQRYDAIVVGARAAGSSTAMLLARAGMRVLAVDRATFPSDAISTHQVQLPGIARLRRWGLLDRLDGAGTPATRHVRFHTPLAVLDGHFPTFDGVDALYSPRRTVLDAMLVDAAREAGAEAREGFTVDEVVSEDGRVVGVRGRAGNGAQVTERASIVIGADGKHSMVAAAVGAQVERAIPARTVASYTYWRGLPTGGGEVFQKDRRAVGLWPTNDGLTSRTSRGRSRSSSRSARTSRATTSARSRRWATWPSACMPPSERSGSARRPTCRTWSARRTVPGGRSWATPVS